MTDNPDGRRWRWKHWGWAFLAALVLYPVSVIPVCLTGAWLVEWHIVPLEPISRAVSTFYAPLEWVLDQSPAAERAMNSATRPFQPLLPPHR
jgi:hypothetical protein